MINLETQSKQLCLLQDYVLALERENKARQTQSQQMQRAIDQSLQNEKNTYEAFTTAQKQNDFLKYVLSQVNHEHRDFQGLKMDFDKLHETMGREQFEKMELYSQIQDVSDSWSNAAEQNKKFSQEIQRLNMLLDLERQRCRQLKRLQQSKEYHHSLISASNLEKIKGLIVKIQQLQQQKQNSSQQLKQLQAKTQSLEVANRELSSKMEQSKAETKIKLDSYKMIIIKKTSQIEKNTNQVEELVGKLHEKVQQNDALKKELNVIKQRLAFVQRQFDNLRKQNNKMFSQLPQIAEKNQQIAKLEKKNRIVVQRLEEYQERIKQIQNEHSRHIENIQSDNYEKIKTKNLQLTKIQEVKQALQDQIQEQQKKMRNFLNESQKIQEELKKIIAQQVAELKSKQDRISDLEMTFEIQKLYRKKSMPEQTLLSENIQQLSTQIFSQKATIHSLTVCMQQKQKEVQSLEQSNGSLRRLMMTSIANEQKALNQLQKNQRKSSNPSTKGQTRIKIHYDSTLSFRESAVLEKGMRASKSYANIENDRRILFKKRATPSQCQFNEKDQSVRQVSR